MREKRKGRKLISRIFAGLICAILVATLLPGLPKNVEAATPLSGDQVPTSTKIFIKDTSDPRGYRELTESEITGTETLVVEYSWPDNKTLADLGFSTGVEYALPVNISNIVISSVGTLESDIKNTDDESIGTLSAGFGGGSNFATVQFSKNDQYLGTLGLACTIDPNATADAEGNVDIKFNGTTLISVKVNSLKATGPMLEKTFVDGPSAKGEVTWKAKYTSPSSNYEDLPLTLVDTIPPGMEFVSGSVSDSTVSASASVGKVTFTIPAAWKTTPKTDHEFTYKTIISDADKTELLNGSNSTVKTYTNSMIIEGEDKNHVAKTDFLATPASASTQQIKGGSYSIASKSGSYAGSNTVNWTITLDSMGIAGYGFTIKDTFGSELGTPTDFKVNGQAIPSGKISNTGGVCTISMADADLAAAKAQSQYPKYVITYSTELTQGISYYAGKGSIPDEVKNTINVDWFIGSVKKGDVTGIKVGPGNLLTSAQPIKKVADQTWKYKGSDGVPAGQINFSFTSTIENADLYNAGDNEISDILSPGVAGSPSTFWIVDSRDAIISALSSLDWTVKGDTFKWVDGSGVETAATTSDTTTNVKTHVGFKVTVTGKPTSGKSFKVTAATDDKVYLTTMRPGTQADNKGIKNTLTVNGSSVSATTRLETQQQYAIKKNPVSYDAENKRIKWKIEVFNDGFAVALGTIKLVDTLDSKLSYVADTTKVKYATAANATPADTDNGPNPSVSGSVLTWTLPHTKNEYVVMTYESEVKSSVTDDMFLTDVTFGNNVSLDLSDIHGDSNHNLTASNNAKLPGRKPVVKGGAIVGSTNDLHYEVQINPYSVELPKNNEKNYQLMDKLADGVILNESSVKLYKGEVVAPLGGGNTFGVEVRKATPETVIPATVKYDVIKNTFTVDLPADANTQPYFLDYHCLATKPGDLQNDITIVDATKPNSGPTNTKNLEFKASVFASAKKYNPSELPGVNIYAVELTKVDKDGGAAITSAPATFELWAGASQLLSTASTDNTGKAMFYVPGSLVDTATSSFYLKESVAPTGYMLSKQVTEVKVADLKAATEKKYAVSIENSKTEEIQNTSGVDLGSGGSTTPPPGSSTTPPDNGTTPPADGSTTPPAGGGTSGSGSTSGGGGGTSGGGGGSSAPLSVPSVTVPGPVLSTTQTDPAPTAPATPEGTPEAPALTPDGTPAVEGAPEAPAAPAVTVTFQSDLGNIPAPQTMTPGQVAYNPGAPLDPASLQPGMVINGQRFEGWYTDPQFKNAYKFGTPVTEDMVLYAKWTKVGVAGKSPKTADNNWVLFILAGSVAVLLAGGIRLIKSRSKDN